MGWRSDTGLIEVVGVSCISITALEAFFESAICAVAKHEEFEVPGRSSLPFCLVLLDFFRELPLAGSSGRARFASFGFNWTGVLSIIPGDTRGK